MKTEKFIEAALMEQLRDKSIDRIKVSDILRDVGICKCTFYRYYRDKYELLVSAFRHRYYDAILAEAETWEQFVAACLNAFEKDGAVVLNAFDSNDVNSLRFYHEELIYSFLDKAMAQRALPVDKPGKFSMRLCASCYTSEMLRWLAGEKTEDAAEMVRLMGAALPQAISSIADRPAV